MEKAGPAEGAQGRRTGCGTGEQEEKVPSFVSVSPAPSAAVHHSTVTGEDSPSPPPLSLSRQGRTRLELRSKKLMTGTKFFIISVFCQDFLQAVACLFIFLAVSFEKHMFVILMMFNISVFFLLPLMLF